MTRTLTSLLVASSSALTVPAYGQPSTPALSPPSRAQFDAYWSRGQAEITSYVLKQSRYGEVHDGHAVTVFVTEPFSRRKQVKLDNPGASGRDHVPVLKLNLTRKFNTGVYPYSMMTSVFTPRTLEPTIKVTTTSQEWCGHTFTQLNLRGDVYDTKLFSYFESESDRRFEVPRALTEDELFTRIRLDPSRLPTGAITLIPGTTYQRLRHTRFGNEKATAALRRGKTMHYLVKYRELPRTLDIEFEAAFPHRIIGWTETLSKTPSKRLTTRATRKATLMSDYWNRNGNVDRKLRDQLGLP
jgi:hypothetical protein